MRKCTVPVVPWGGVYIASGAGITLLVLRLCPSRSIDGLMDNSSSEEQTLRTAGVNWDNE